MDFSKEKKSKPNTNIRISVSNLIEIHHTFTVQIKFHVSVDTVINRPFVYLQTNYEKIMKEKEKIY